MAKRGKKTLMDSLKGIVVSGKSPGSKAGRSAKARAKADNAAKLQRRDLLSPFVVATIDLDPLINPLPGRARPIPNELPSGRVLVSQQHGVKCLLLADLEKVGIQKLRSICARKLSEEEAIFMPMGTQILRDEALHQGKRFTIKLRKGTLFLSPGGHPNGYLLEPLQLPLRKELSQNHQFLMVTEQIAERYLQNLVDIPASFAVVKEDVFGGIHLTGVRRDPHQCSAADRHGRFAPGRSRLGGQLPRPSAGNEILETHRLVGHGQLEPAIKHHAAAAGSGGD